MKVHFTYSSAALAAALLGLTSPLLAQDKPGEESKNPLGEAKEILKDIKDAVKEAKDAVKGEKEGEAETKPKKNNKGVEMPEDLLDDEHVQEEFGVSALTAPSIKKLFEQLDALGSLPYDDLKRPVPDSLPKDRALVALSLGVLIGDGFLSVQSEKISDLEDIGRSILKHAKLLGAGARITERTKGILESSALSDWKALKQELSQTQREVQQEMVLLRDVDLVHLISMGGWLRGMQIVSGASLKPFSAQKAQTLARPDISGYFLHTLETFEEKAREHQAISSLYQGLTEMHTVIDLPEGKPFTQEEVEKLHKLSTDLLAILTPIKK